MKSGELLPIVLDPNAGEEDFSRPIRAAGSAFSGVVLFWFLAGAVVQSG
ncbi:MAG: hypothetical protein HRU01_03510 [Myxococcales bacterium]|nr:hypothetical protein [Myxococcales bacterium]